MVIFCPQTPTSGGFWLLVNKNHQGIIDVLCEFVLMDDV
jgi:hypothetical protein